MVHRRWETIGLFRAITVSKLQGATECQIFCLAAWTSTLLTTRAGNNVDDPRLYSMDMAWTRRTGVRSC